VIVLDDRAGQGVLDRYHRRSRPPRHHHLEQLVEVTAGEGLHLRTEEAAGGLLAEGAPLALEGRHCLLGRGGRVLHAFYCPGDRILYPTWRTVSMTSPPVPSLAPSRRRWMSTVRVLPV